FYILSILAIKLDERYSLLDRFFLPTEAIASLEETPAPRSHAMVAEAPAAVVEAVKKPEVVTKLAPVQIEAPKPEHRPSYSEKKTVTKKVVAKPRVTSKTASKSTVSKSVVSSKRSVASTSNASVTKKSKSSR